MTFHPPARSSGVLLHVTSLPGPHGIGDFGPAAFHFVDWLAGAGDHGDPDLALALQELVAGGRRVALCVHGHMHHTLRGARACMKERESVCMCVCV